MKHQNSGVSNSQSKFRTLPKFGAVTATLLAGTLGTLFLKTGNFSPASAQDNPQCVVPGYLLQNEASYSYTSDGINQIEVTSNRISDAVVGGGPVTINPGGIRDGGNNRVSGAFAGALADELIKLGFTQAEATRAVIAVTVTLAQMPVESSFREVAIATRTAVFQAVPNKASTIARLSRPEAQETAIALTAELSKSILQSDGLTEAEAETVSQQLISTLVAAGDNAPIDDTFRAAFQAMVSEVPDRETLLRDLAEDFVEEIRNLRNGVRSGIEQGDVLFFDFTLNNPTDSALRFQIPDANAVQEETTNGIVRGVSYSMIGSGSDVFLVRDCFPEPEPEEPGPIVITPSPDIDPLPQPGEQPPSGEQPPPGPPPTITPAPDIPPPPTITPTPTPTPTPIPEQPQPQPQPITTPTDVIIPPGGGVQIVVEVEVGPIDPDGGGVTVNIPSLETPEQPPTQQTVIITPTLPGVPDREGLGRITGCAGELLPDYTGFRVGLYQPNPADPTGGIQGVVPLTPTDIRQGLAPNLENANPFFLTNGEQGTYNFLLDVTRGQLDPGQQYIFLVSPPAGSEYAERRIRIDIVANNNGIVSYTATALDGRPLNVVTNSTVANGTIDIRDRDQVGLNLGTFDLTTSLCEAQEIQIDKTGDRIAAEPGDTVIYRLAIRNLANTPVTGIIAADFLPLGFQFREDSVRAEISGQQVAITSSHEGRAITFDASNITIPPTEVLNIAYAARITPDALRGNGRNSAFANGRRIDTGIQVQDGPAIHSLRIEPGILSDCGTLIGRVFEDLNGDGEQQPDEPGIPNAVIFLDDGNRIITDEQGLYSVSNVLGGYRTATLDLSSVPGYTLAPNEFVSERNSLSRLVRLEPGGMARVNFAVTPAAEENPASTVGQEGG